MTFPNLFPSLSSGERKTLRNIAVAAVVFLLTAFIVQVINGTGKKEAIVVVPPAPSSGLESQNNFVFRPRFRAIDGEFSAGSAFVTRAGFSDKPLVITALHLLGPGGGYYRQPESEHLRDTFTGLTLREMFTDEAMADFSASALEIPAACAIGSDSMAGDVAAFRIEETSGILFEPAPLATGNTPVSIGSALHLVYRIDDKAERLHKASVFEVRDGLLVYYFDENGLVLRGAAGAPMLNEAGEVAAIHLGNGEQNGRQFGIANPVSRFRSRLEVACRAKVQITPEAKVTASTDPVTTP